jgi:hypothetical protein
MSWPRILGITVRSLLLGTLLFLAIMKLIALRSGAQVFHYEGF